MSEAPSNTRTLITRVRLDDIGAVVAAEVGPSTEPPRAQKLNATCAPPQRSMPATGPRDGALNRAQAQTVAPDPWKGCIYFIYELPLVGTRRSHAHHCRSRARSQT